MLARSLVLLPLCLILAVSTARSGDKKEQEKLEGTWSMVDIKGGKEKHDKDSKVTFKGDKITLKTKDKTMDATYSVDPSKKPGTLDLHVEMGDKKATLHMIYKIDGDNLTVAHFEGEKFLKDHPTDLKSSDDVVVATLKREKK